MRNHGFSLVELLVGGAILLATSGGLLLSMQYSMMHSDSLRNFQVAMPAAQGELEQLASVDFDELDTGPAYAAARGTGLPVPMAGLPGGMLSVQIQPVVTATNAKLLEVRVAACWTTRGRRFGEDLNCNGVRDAGEDANANTWLDSPVMAVTRIAQKD